MNIQVDGTKTEVTSQLLVNPTSPTETTGAVETFSVDITNVWNITGSRITNYETEKTRVSQERGH